MQARRGSVPMWMNKAILVGRLTREPKLEERKEIQVCEFTLACNRSNSSEVDFLDVVTFRGLAERCGRYLVKGQAVAISGRIDVQSYEDRDGVSRKAWKIIASEVEFLGKPQADQEKGQGTNGKEGDRRDGQGRNSGRGRR